MKHAPFSGLDSHTRRTPSFSGNTLHRGAQTLGSLHRHDRDHLGRGKGLLSRQKQDSAEEIKKKALGKGEVYYPSKYTKPTYSTPHYHHHHHHVHTSSSVRPYYYQNVYYPYYNFYWYNYDYYSPFFSNYYRYYLTHGFPYVYYHGPLVLFSGRTFTLNDHVGSLSHLTPKLKQCSHGPEYYFTVRVHGKVFRVFLGDVNDYFNVQCLYMMNAVISVGEIDYAQKVFEIFNKPAKTIHAHGKSIEINPFKNSKFTPSNVQIEDLSHNMKEISFDLEGHSLPTKSIVFYHQDNIAHLDYEDIFRDISQEVSSGNVLFVIDQFQKHSVKVFRHYLVKYRRFTPRVLHRIRYKNYYVFPRH